MSRSRSLEPPGKPRLTFYSEPIIVDPASISTAALAKGAPGCPMRFVWRGKEYRVATILEVSRQLRAHDSRETYVRSHSFRVVTECGYEMILRCDRQVRGNPWRVFAAGKLSGAATLPLVEADPEDPDSVAADRKRPR